MQISYINDHVGTNDNVLSASTKLKYMDYFIINPWNLQETDRTTVTCAVLGGEAPSSLVFHKGHMKQRRGESGGEPLSRGPSHRDTIGFIHCKYFSFNCKFAHLRVSSRLGVLDGFVSAATLGPHLKLRPYEKPRNA